MKHLSLFTGIGGIDRACETVGIETVGQIEIDPFCQKVLAVRFLHSPRWLDVRQWQSDGHEPVDLLTAGFPCQDLSVAGKRAGLAGKRSGLFWEIVRIAKATKPTWGLFENVPGLLSSHGGRDFALVLAGLRDCWPAVGYRILDSQYFGVAQRRRRVFLVCGSTERSVAQVLFESEGSERDSAQGREAGASVAGNIAVGINNSGLRGRQPGSAATMIAQPLLSHHGRNAPDSDNLIASPITSGYANGVGVNDGQKGSPQNLIVHPLSSEGADASEDGTGRGTPLVWPDLRRHDDRHRGMNREKPTLNMSNNDLVGLRRLTPLEAERLQGFPDGWTCLCQPLDAYAENPDEAALRCTCPDSPRYRALGNAVTVNVVEWLLHRMRNSLDA